MFRKTTDNNYLKLRKNLLQGRQMFGKSAVRGVTIVEAMVSIAIFGLVAYSAQNLVQTNRMAIKSGAEDARFEAFEGLLRGQLYATASRQLETMKRNNADQVDCAARDPDLPPLANPAAYLEAVEYPASGTRFGYLSMQRPISPISALILINRINAMPAVSGAPDSPEAYMAPLWRECMISAVRSTINLLNGQSRGGGARPTEGVEEFAVTNGPCLPLGGYPGYKAIPRENSSLGSFLKEPTMGYYTASAWDFVQQKKIACGPSSRAIWPNTKVRGYKIRYGLMWERRGKFRARTGTLDVYEP